MAALKQRIRQDMKAALVGGDRFVAETLRTLNAAILNEEVARGLRDSGLDDQSVEQVIVREAKKRRDAAGMYRQHDRLDLAASEEQELAVLQQYLPKPLTPTELQTIIKAAITEVAATDARQMGQVMGVVKARVGNRADGAEVAALVKQMLA